MIPKFSKNKYYKFLLLSLIAGLYSNSLLAQNQFNLNNLQPGQLILNLSATTQQSVDQDTLNINLQYIVQGRDKTALQDEVNQAISEALGVLEDSVNIDYSSQQYYVYSFQPARARRDDIDNPAWRAQQGIQLSSLDSDELLEVTGILQGAGLTISNLYYSLSTEKYEEISDSMMNMALLNLQSRANEAASTLNKSTADLVEIDINGGGNYFSAGGGGVYRQREALANANIATPVAEPGTTQVSITVSARALLSP